MSCQRSVWPLALAAGDGLKCKFSRYSKPQAWRGRGLLSLELQKCTTGGFQTPLQTTGRSHAAHPSLFPAANLQLNATKNTASALLAIFHASPWGGLQLPSFGGERSRLLPSACGWVGRLPVRLPKMWFPPNAAVNTSSA